MNKAPIAIAFLTFSGYMAWLHASVALVCIPLAVASVYVLFSD